MEKTIRWFTRNHVAANFLMLLVVIAGFATWFKLRKEIFPETSVDSVLINIPYPNATPEEVENGLIVPIEEAIADLEGIEEIASTAAQGNASIVVEAKVGYKTRDLMDDIKTRVDAIQNLAEEAEQPVIEDVVIKREVMSIAVSADVDEKTLRSMGEQVRDGLLAYKAPPAEGFVDKLSRLVRGDPKITQVELAGVRPYEISIEVSEDTLRRYGLSLEEIALAVGSSSLDLPGGSVRTEGGEVLIRAVGKRYRAEDFRTIEVRTEADGSVLKLGDIAQVLDAFEDVDITTDFDGRQAVLVNVFRVGNEDTIELAQMVRSYVKEARNGMPKNVSLEIWNDQSIYLEGRLDLLARNGLSGLLLVFLALALFLRPSLAFLVALGIPVSFAGAIWLMPVTGVSINMISLFAFILVLGIVVDDAIVVGENVYTRMRRGEDPKIAAWKGTHEVGVVVIFGILTTMAAFTPMLGLSGVSGKIWPNIPLIVIPTLAFSLLQSKFVLPSHLALLRPSGPDRKVGPLGRLQQGIANGLERFVERVYAPFLDSALKARYVVACLFLAVLMIIVALLKGGWVKTGFFPEVEADIVTAKVTMPSGVAFEETAAVVERMQNAALAINEIYKDREGNPVIVHMLASAGTQPMQFGFNAGGPPTSSNIGEITLELRPAATRDVMADDIVNKWRELVGNIPGTEEVTFMAISATGASAFDLELAGDDMDELREAAEYVKDQLANYTGVIDIADNNRLGKRELKVKGLKPQGEALGMNLGSAIGQIRNSFYGYEVQRLQRGRDEVKVMVRYPKAERESLYNVGNMKLRTPEGGEVPYEEVIDAEFGRGYATIQRSDRRRAIKVTADIDKTIEGANANEIIGRFTGEVLEDLNLKFPGVSWQFKGEQKDQRQSLREIGTKFVFALLMIYVLMAVPLKSYFQPLIVMTAIPFGLVGAVIGHIIFGMELSIMSMCGIVALAGVVVNDSLVLVDYVNRHRDDGHGVEDAARKAGSARFRAVLLTSLTTFLGLTPMLLETDIQARFLIPMAVSLSFGILFATIITLVLVPCIYLMIEDFKRLVLTREAREKMDESRARRVAEEAAEH